jgi:DNA repair ATPase RecN
VSEITLETIAAQIETIKIQVSGLPLIASSLLELREDVRELRRETRLVKAAINDMARVNITAGEVEALHDDLDKLANALIDIKSRLALLEKR